MIKTLKRHLHPLGGHIIFWNIALLVLVKVILPHSTFPLATIIEQGPLFNSREVVTLTNEIRVENNLPALKSDFKLDLAASEKLNDMIRNNYFAHTSPAGVTPWFWIKKSNYTYSVAGENLAVGFFTAQDTVDAWFKSSSHRANLLSSRYKDIGIAVGRGQINGHNGIVVVQMFGLPSGQTVAVANPSPTVPAQPALALAPPQVSSQVAAAETQSDITPQSVSTDETIKPVKRIIPIASDVGQEINNVISSANSAFMIYSFALAIFTIMSFFLFNQNRRMALKSLVHVNIFLLSVVLSSAEVFVKASIY